MASQIIAENQIAYVAPILRTDFSRALRVSFSENAMAAIVVTISAARLVIIRGFRYVGNDVTPE